MTENLKNVAPIDDFDWAAYAQDDPYSKDSREKLAESYDNTLSKINDKEVEIGRAHV